MRGNQEAERRGRGGQVEGLQGPNQEVSSGGASPGRGWGLQVQGPPPPQAISHLTTLVADLARPRVRLRLTKQS